METGTHTRTVDTESTIADECLISLDHRTDSGCSVYIQSVTLYGIGENPFA